MRIVCVDHYFSHHGRHSGYQMLAQFVADEHMLDEDHMCLLLSIVPDEWLYRVPPFHPLWYTRKAFGVEAKVAVRLMFKKQTLFHFLYGEHLLRWADKVNHWTGHQNRIVATYHQLPRFFEQRRKQYGHLRYLDAIVLVASNQREFFDSVVDCEKVHVIPHGVDTVFFRPFPRSREESRLIRCLTVGSNYRDFDLHIQVIRNINHRLGSEIEFVIVGEPRCAEYFVGLDNVRYLSGISDNELLKCYQMADILLLPLVDATACNALLEGMACGLPIVVTDVGGVRDYVDEACAVLVPARDASAMAEQLLALLEDESRRTEIGNLARQRAVEYFDWRSIAQRMRRVYASLW